MKVSKAAQMHMLQRNCECPSGAPVTADHTVTVLRARVRGRVREPEKGSDSGKAHSSLRCQTEVMGRAKAKWS